MASTWDPPAADRERLRVYARRVGDHLRAALDYRGAFSIDGVMTAEGFRPTELNPRFSAALNLLDAAVGIPLYLLHLAVVEQVEADWRAAELERTIVAGADVARQVRCHVVVDRPVGDHTIGLVRDGTGLTRTAAADADIAVRCGPATVGTFVRVSVSPGTMPTGTSVAPLVADALAWADEHLDLGIGPLEAAPDLRQA